MVIDDFYDLHFTRALHGLRQFIVVHQNQFPLDALQKIRFGHDARDPIVRVQDWKDLMARSPGFLAGGGQRRVFGKRDEFLVQDVPHRHRRAA